MHRFPSDFTFNPQSTPLTSVASSPAPALQPPTDDAIEAVILQATSARQASETRPLRDTRTQLFIGNLPYRVRWQDLKDLFRKAGTVLRADVSLGADNRSRGYGTVLLATAEDAGRAVDMFNGYSWQSRVLEVRLDRLLPEYESQPVATGSSPASASSSSYPMASTSSHQGSSSISEEHEYMSMYQSNDPASCRNLFVGNLPFHCQWQDLKDLFRQAGTILRADVALGPDGRSRGFGTVVFATEYDAERAVKMFNGFEYNNRILKVNYDKFSQANQPITASGSPVTANAQGQPYGNNMQIKLPPGFMLDFVPPSGTTSPYEMFSQLQQQHQHQQRQQNRQPSQMLHQPQAQHYLQQQHLQQQRLQQQPQQPPSHAYNLQSALDIESLTNTLASSHLSKPLQTSQRAASAHKPSPISTAASSTHTSSSSEQSMASTSASSVSQSPNPLHALQQNQTQQQQQPQQHQHQHPHHPGPITLPPLRAPMFPLPPHTPQASVGMPPSPLHHPNMGSPYQMYSSSVASAHSAAYQQHYQQQQQQRTQMVPLTPHGLPPITPSMPPFTFLPSSFNHGHHQAARAAVQHQQQQHVSSSSKDSSTSGSSAANPAASSSSSASASASASGASYHPSSDSANNPNNLQNPPTMQYASYATPNQHFIVPLPSPGLYMAAQQQPPSPPLHLRLNLAGIPGAFSPGVAMSPGTFYGRPGEVPNPNPFINAAVGAPVHVHSPGGHAGPPMAGSPGGMMPMYGQGHPHVTHGAYFYAMSSPKQGPPSAMEPKGYFDPMYFPVGAVGGGGGGGVGSSGLANEIMRDKDSNSGSAASTERKDPMESEEFSSPPGEMSVGTGTEGTEASASAASSGSSLTSWYTGDIVDGASPDVAAAAEKSGREHDPKASSGDEGSDETVTVVKLGEGSTISRTHSVGYKKKDISAGAEGPGTMSRGNSDPVYGSSTSDAGDGRGAEAGAAPLTLRLPERVPWSRKQEAVVQTPTARTASADYLDVGGEGEQQPSASSTSLPSTSSQ